MKKYSIWTKIVSVLMAIIMVVLMFPTTADAANKTTKFSTPYKNSIYYTKLQNAKKTAGTDKAAKFVAVAESQLGYKEGIKYSDLDGRLSNGTTKAKKMCYKKNGKWKTYSGYLDCCEYNFWYYGASDNSKVSKYASTTKTVSGASYPVSNYDKAWCAAFVSWCAAQAGVSDLIPANVGCGGFSRGIIKKGGQIVDASQIKPGDIVFYYCAKCDARSHTGIVSSNVKYSIEGNTNDGVSKVNIEGTCKKTCMNGHVTTRYFVRPAFCDHTSTYSKVTTAATCQSTGVKTYYCKDCNVVVKTTTIKQTDHKYDKYNHCSMCGIYYPLKAVSGKSGIYKTTKDTPLRSTPYAKGKGGSSNLVTTIPKNTVISVKTAGRNRQNNLWYSVEYKIASGETVTGFVYGNNVKYVQNTFTFYEGSTKLFDVVVGGTPQIPTTSAEAKEGSVLLGFNIYKKSSGYKARYYTEDGQWVTAANAEKNGYTYKLFKPGTYFSFGANWINAQNKNKTSYYLVPVCTEKATYQVTYFANGGSNAPSAQTKQEGVDITLSTAIPTRSGYVFAGWATSSAGSVVYNEGSIYSANQPVNLYAVWVLNPIKWDSVYVKNVTSTSAYVGCTVTADCSKINRIGLQLRTSNGTWTSVASWKVNSVLNYCTVQCGGKNAEAPALAKGTTYYYRFYVETTNVGVQYSPQKSFTTSY